MCTRVRVLQSPCVRARVCGAQFECVCVCVCVRARVFVWVCVGVCLCVCIHTHVYVYVYAFLYIYVYPALDICCTVKKFSWCRLYELAQVWEWSLWSLSDSFSPWTTFVNQTTRMPWTTTNVEPPPKTCNPRTCTLAQRPRKTFEMTTRKILLLTYTFGPSHECRFNQNTSVTDSTFTDDAGKGIYIAIKRQRTRFTAARQVSTAHERDLVTNQNV